MNAPYRRLVIALGVLIGLTLVSSTVVGGVMGTGTMMMPGMMGTAGTGMMPHMGGWTMGIGMGLMWLTMFAFWGALIVGIIMLVKWLTDTNSKAVQ
jgi:hypothetical protein